MTHLEGDAAIQKALLDVRRGDSPKRVLYFPAGTYRITDTLKLDRISHNEPLGMSIAGEDPEKTVIRWDGPGGGNMLRYNAWFASLSRLTFDGAGKAKTAIEHGEKFTTANDLQLVGDGPENATQLSNAGGADPLIRVEGPSHATFRNFLANAGNAAVGVLVENCDQPGACIFGEQLNTTGYEYGFVTNHRIELGGPDVKAQVVAEHVRVFRKEPAGLDAVEGTGKATPDFIREMLKPLREVKPQPLAAPREGVTDVRFYRAWANGRNGVRVQAAAAR